MPQKPKPTATKQLTKTEARTKQLVLEVPDDCRIEPYLAAMVEAIRLHTSKSADYGTGSDPYANIRAAEDFGIPTWLGCAIRMNDKVIRVKSFALKGVLVNEPVRDAFLDIINYAAFALIHLPASPNVTV